jgi:hypothetical protein
MQYFILYFISCIIEAASEAVSLGFVIQPPMKQLCLKISN